MNDLEVTLQGEPFEHILFHSVLPYSNWEWGRVVQSESLLSIRLGLQSTLLKLGYVPQAHQTDHTTAATHTLGVADRQSPRERGYNEEYLQLLAHYGSGSAHDPSFESERKWRREIIQRRTETGSETTPAAARQPRLRERRSLRRYFCSTSWRSATLGDRSNWMKKSLFMKPLTAKPWPQMRELNVRVGQNGILRVGSNGYSVPSGLKGKRVTARIYEWHIEVWYANQRIESLPRVPGAHHYQINYRHVIDSLLRKPGGFRNYRYRADLFPLEVFRQAWDVLNEHLPPRRADLIYLRILKQAALGMESDIAQALTLLLGTKPNRLG